MKKALALLLALIMCISIFAACGEEKTPAADVPANNPDTPSNDNTEPENPNLAIAYLDMTESYTLVIEKAGTVGDERIGVRCAAGKIQAGTYNTSGKKRTASWEFDFASLGLEGHSWEYLGAKVEIDTSDPSNPKIINTPVKSTFAVKTADLKFPDELTCELPNGIKIDLPTCNYGILRPNNLLNEGGWFIPGWNDKTTILNAQNNHFVNPNYIQEWAIFTVVDYNGTPINMYIHTNTDIAAHAEEIESQGTSSQPETPDTPATPDTPSHTHTWGEGKVTKEASCKEAGVKTFTCECGETKTEEITKLTTHSYDEGKKVGINTVFTCSICGDTKTEAGEPIMESVNILMIGGTAHTMAARESDFLLKKLLEQDAGVKNVRVDTITVNGERGRIDQLFTYEKWDVQNNINNIAGVATNEARATEYNSIVKALDENATVKYDYVVFATALDWNLVATQPYYIREINSLLHFESIIAKHNPDATIVVSVTPPMEEYVQGSGFGLYDQKVYPIAATIEEYAAVCSAQGAAIAKALNESEPVVKVIVSDAAKGFMTGYNAGKELIDYHNDGYTWPGKDSTKYPDENKFYYYPFEASAYLVAGTLFCEITGLDADALTVTSWSNADGSRTRDITDTKEPCDFETIKSAIAEAIK